MNKLFQIKKIKSDYEYVVISKFYFRIDEYIDDVRNTFRERYYKGYVLFDCLLSNGPNQRFLVAYFDGVQFDFKTFKTVEKVEKDTEIQLNQYYKRHQSLIDNNSILSDSQKFLLKKELEKVSSVRTRRLSFA